MSRKAYRRKPPQAPKKNAKLAFAKLYTGLGIIFLLCLVCGELLFGDPIRTLPGILYLGLLYVVGGITFQAVLKQRAYFDE